MKNWGLKTELNGTGKDGGNARLPAMTALLIPGLYKRRAGVEGTLSQGVRAFGLRRTLCFVT